MKAIILAAGRGSRLKNLTSNKPKSLVEFNQRPLLEHTILSLRKGGITEIGIVAGYRKEMLESYADELFLNEQWASTGIFHSLSQARAWLDNHSCIISYSDIFYPVQTVIDLIDDQSDIAVAYDPEAVGLWSKRFKEPLDDLEGFVIDENEEIKVIGGVPSTLEEIQGQYMGLMKLTPKGWEALVEQQQKMEKSSSSLSDMTSLFSSIISEGKVIKGVSSTSPWGEIDCPSDIRLYESMYPNL